MKTQKNRPLVIVVVLLILGAVLIGSCASAKNTAQDYRMLATPEYAGEAVAEEYYDSDEAGFESEGKLGVYDTPNSERVIIMTSDISISVPDPAESMEEVTSMANQMDGYVVSANLYKRELEDGVQVSQASVTIRVPSERLDEAIEQIKAMSEAEPINITINSQDVTREYTDLQSRLRNLESAEKQLQEIMDSANRTEDVLHVYNELVRVREQIEIIKGQINYFEQSAALSAISIELIADEALQPLSIGGWQPAGIARNALQALINTLKGLVNIGIWILIYLLPVLLILLVVIVVPVILIIRAIRKNKKNKEQPEEKEGQSSEETKD